MRLSGSPRHIDPRHTSCRNGASPHEIDFLREGGPASDRDLTDAEYSLDRELSSLAFQERVLREGMDERDPPLERLRFLAFFSENTDESFLKRGGLGRQIDADVTEMTPDGRTPIRQRHEVLGPIVGQQRECRSRSLRGLRVQYSVG